jgi:HSP20 family protein
MNEDELKEDIKRTFNGESDLPTVEMTDLPESYIIELPLPGLNREDFLIHADGNVLSVCVCHKSCQPSLSEATEKHSFEFGLLDHHIDLPGDADAVFISAEYNLGILRFHIPKINQPVRNLHTRIVVY